MKRHKKTDVYRDLNSGPFLEINIETVVDYGIKQLLPKEQQKSVLFWVEEKTTIVGEKKNSRVVRWYNITTVVWTENCLRVTGSVKWIDTNFICNDMGADISQRREIQ